MPNRRSFTNYIRNTFFNEIYQEVEKYFNKNKKTFDLEVERFIRQWNPQLYDIDILYVNAEDIDKSSMKIAFYPIVVATIQIEGKTKYDIEIETKEIWFRLHCTGDLAQQLKDFTINHIEEVQGKRSRVYPVTDTLVPYIKPQDLDIYATTILERYFPEALERPMPVNAKFLAKRMGLKIYSAGISDDLSIFGQIYFQECKTRLYSFKSQQKEKVTVPANTIIIDPRATDLFSLQTKNITVAHECVHYALHRKAFEFERLCNESFTKIQCCITGDVMDVERQSDTSWMEWQANIIAPKIVMPFAMFNQKAKEFIDERLGESGDLELLDVIEFVIDDLASFFGVSRAAAKTRMVEVGFEEAAGTYIYVDGEYVKPHKASKKGIIKDKQTYSISRENVPYVLLADERVRDGVESGRYVFVDSHIVLNTPKYIESNTFGKIALTRYARYHMEECCLLFDVEIVSKHNIGSRYHSYCILNRDIDAPYELQIKFNKGYENATEEKQAEYLRAVEKEIYDTYVSLPRDFKGTMEALKKWRNATNQMIADEVCCDEKTIRRIINGETGTTINMIVAMCMALKLPPRIIYDVIEKSTEKLQLINQEHWNLNTLITTASGRPMKEVRMVARRLGIENF